MKMLFPVLLFAFLTSACQPKIEEANTVLRMSNLELEPTEADKVVAYAPPHAADANAQQSKQKIIKEGQIGLKVNDLEKSKKHIDELVMQNHGYYQKEGYDNKETELKYELKIRIPADAFDNFVAFIGTEGDKVLYKNINAHDVTEEYIDITTRLENKKAYLNRYQALLRQAKDMKDILEIEEKIRALEEEIESTTGRIRYIDDQVSFSTLYLTITKEIPYKYVPTEEPGFGERLKESASDGWKNLIDLLLYLIEIWPLYLILAACIPIFRWLKRKISKGFQQLKSLLEKKK